MSDQYKKGDVFVRFGKIHQVFKIENKKIDGKVQSIIFYKKLFPGKKGEIICSIPTDNIERIKLRKPYSKKELKDFLKSLKEDRNLETDLNLNNIKDPYELDLNDLAILMKSLKLEEKDPKIKLSFSKRDLFSKVFNSIKEEIAYVFDIDLVKAEEKINSVLNG